MESTAPCSCCICSACSIIMLKTLSMSLSCALRWSCRPADGSGSQSSTCRNSQSPRSNGGATTHEHLVVGVAASRRRSPVVHATCLRLTCLGSPSTQDCLALSLGHQLRRPSTNRAGPRNQPRKCPRRSSRIDKHLAPALPPSRYSRDQAAHHKRPTLAGPSKSLRTAKAHRRVSAFGRSRRSHSLHAP